MESKSKEAESGIKKTIAVDWESQEWFEVWLQLSRHAGQGHKDNPRAMPTADQASTS